MPLVATPTTTNVVGNERMVRGTLAFDNSYPTGGEPVTLSELGLSQLSNMYVFPSQQGVVCSFNPSGSRVMAFHSNDPGASIGPLVEVANATDLSAVVGVPFIAFGR